MSHILNVKTRKNHAKYVKEFFADLWEKYRYYSDLIYVLTLKEFKVRYKSSILGYLWSVLNPICLALIYYLAFKVFLRIDMENYLAFLLAGIFPWQLIANTVGSAPQHFLGNPAFIKKIRTPIIVVVVVNSLQNMIHFLLSLPAYIFVLLYSGLFPDLLLWMWAIPALLFASFLLVMGMALIVATINMFLRDVEHINSIILQMLFFGTPIIYSVDMVPQKYLQFMYFNPYTMLIVTWNGVLFKNDFRVLWYLIALGTAFLVFCIGYALYRKLSWKFAEVL